MRLLYHTFYTTFIQNSQQKKVKNSIILIHNDYSVNQPKGHGYYKPMAIIPKWLTMSQNMILSLLNTLRLSQREKRKYEEEGEQD